MGEPPSPNVTTIRRFAATERWPFFAHTESPAARDATRTQSGIVHSQNLISGPAITASITARPMLLDCVQGKCRRAADVNEVPRAVGDLDSSAPAVNHNSGGRLGQMKQRRHRAAGCDLMERLVQVAGVQNAGGIVGQRISGRLRRDRSDRNGGPKDERTDFGDEQAGVTAACEERFVRRNCSELSARQVPKLPSQRFH
jgi:hypothetical protein